MSEIITNKVKNGGRSLPNNSSLRGVDNVLAISVSFLVPDMGIVSCKIEVDIIQGKCDSAKLLGLLVVIFYLKQFPSLIEQKGSSLIVEILDKKEFDRVLITSQLVVGTITFGIHEYVELEPCEALFHLKEVWIIDRGIATHLKNQTTFTEMYKGFGEVLKVVSLKENNVEKEGQTSEYLSITSSRYYFLPIGRSKHHT